MHSEQRRFQNSRPRMRSPRCCCFLLQCFRFPFSFLPSACSLSFQRLPSPHTSLDSETGQDRSPSRKDSGPPDLQLPFSSRGSPKCPGSPCSVLRHLQAPVLPGPPSSVLPPASFPQPHRMHSALPLRLRPSSCTPHQPMPLHPASRLPRQRSSDRASLQPHCWKLEACCPHRSLPDCISLQTPVPPPISLQMPHLPKPAGFLQPPLPQPHSLHRLFSWYPEQSCCFSLLPVLPFHLHSLRLRPPARSPSCPRLPSASLPHLRVRTPHRLHHPSDQARFQPQCSRSDLPWSSELPLLQARLPWLLLPSALPLPRSRHS